MKLGAAIGAIILSIIIIGIIASIAEKITIETAITSLIFGGTGFAIGSIASVGWGIFGAILGGLIGISSQNNENRK